MQNIFVNIKHASQNISNFSKTFICGCPAVSKNIIVDIQLFSKILLWISACPQIRICGNPTVLKRGYPNCLQTYMFVNIQLSTNMHLWISKLSQTYVVDIQLSSSYKNLNLLNIEKCQYVPNY